MKRSWSCSKGSVLVVSLWAIVFFGVITLLLSARTGSQVSVIKRFKDDSSLRLAADSGISYALDVIRRVQDKTADSQSALPADYYWFKDTEIFKEAQMPGDSHLSFMVGHLEPAESEGTSNFVAGLEDESSRININKISESVFAKIYAAADSELGSAKAETLAKATLQWRDRKEPFLEFGHALQGDHSGFGSVEELLLVSGMTSTLWNKLRDHLTVYGKGINLNTVSKETLMLLGIADSLAGRIVSTREGSQSVPATGAGKSTGTETNSKDRPFDNLGDLEQKIGVSSEEDAALQVFSSLWIFDVDTLRFLSVTWVLSKDSPAEPGKTGRWYKVGIECVAGLDGQLLYLREI